MKKKKKDDFKQVKEQIKSSTEKSEYNVYIPKKAKKRVSKVDKPFNNGTMSSSAFFSWLRSRLRKMSQAWKPIQEVKKAAKVPYVGENKRRKFSYKCEKCFELFSDKEVAVHHKIPAGSLKSFEDLPNFCRRLFVEKQGLILLCDNCHSKEHEELDNKTKENGYS